MRLTSNSGSFLMFRSEATEAIREYFGVGRFDYPANRVEQGGLLVGYDIQNRPGAVQTIVTHFFPAYNCVGTATSLDWPAMEGIRLQRQYFETQEALQEKRPKLAERLRIVGWIHSHPNTLPVFISGTDMQNIRDNYNRYDQFSVVLNPHMECWKVYLGPDILEVPAIMHVDRTFFNDDQSEESQKNVVKKRVGQKSTYGKPSKKNRRKNKHKKKG